MKEKMFMASDKAHGAEKGTTRAPGPAHDGITRRIRRAAKVVIVDDKEMIVNTLTRMFKRLPNVEVPENLPAVHSFEEAKALIERHSPDLVITDKQIWTETRGDHLKILGFVREEYPEARIALLTGSFEKGDGIAGFDAVLQKPLGQEDKEKIGRLIDGILRGEGGQTQQTKAKLVILDNEPLIINSIERFLSRICDVPKDIPAVSTYEQAIAVITENQPDIVLCETFGSNMQDHLDTLDFIKAYYPDTIVVLFTSYCPEAYRRSGSNDFDAFIRKDPDSARILEEIEMLVSKE